MTVHISSETISYTVPPEQRGYYELSSAIVATAIKDYRVCRKMTAQREIESIRRFFLSEIFENISGVENPSDFLQRLDRQIDRELAEGIKRKREKQAMKCNG